MWKWNATGATITTQATSNEYGWCLTATAGPPGGQLYTTDGNGVEWCLQGGGEEGDWAGTACTSTGNQGQLFTVNPINGQAGAFTLGGNNAVGWDGQFGASGPVPHSRYIISGGSPYNLNYAALVGGAGSVIAANASNIVDDNLVGNVTSSGGFCLDLTIMGGLEVWVSLLSEWRYAVALFNRSPGDDFIVLQWGDLGVPDSTAFAVRDIWAAEDRGTFTGSYASAVPAHGTVMLVLTPVQQ
jgi:hypothetical protein